MTFVAPAAWWEHDTQIDEGGNGLKRPFTDASAIKPVQIRPGATMNLKRHLPLPCIDPMRPYETSRYWWVPFTLEGSRYELATDLLAD